MASSVLSHRAANDAPTAAPVAERASAGWPLRAVALALLLGGVYYLIDHDFYTSRREAFSSTEVEIDRMMAGGDSGRRVAFAGIALCGLAGLAWSASRPLVVNGWLGASAVAFLAWAAASVLWSIDPEMTVRRLGVLFCSALGAVGLGRWLTPRDLCFVAIVVGLGSVLVGLGAELTLGTFLPWTADYRFAGTLHPNTQGLYIACLCLGAFCLARSERGGTTLYWGLLVVGLVAVVLTKSRTSTAGILFALLAVWSLQASWRWRALAATAVALVGGFAVIALLSSGVNFEAELQQTALLGRNEQAESLTGRLPIWMELSYYIAETPWLGHGYDTFWTSDHVDTIASRIEWTIREAHNGYLDLILGLGLIGLAPVLAMACAGFGGALARYQRTGDETYGLMVGLIAFTLVNCCTESGMFMPQFPAFLAACGLAHLAFTPPPEPGSGI